MLVNISDRVAVWLSAEEIAVLKDVIKQGKYYAKDMTFDNLDAVNKLHRKSLLRRKNQDNGTFYQLRYDLPPLPF